MVTVYALALSIGLVGLVVVIFGGTLMENLGRPDRDPGARIGAGGRIALAALVGLGMAGLSAEYSPLDLGPVSVFALSILGAIGAGAWAAFGAGSGS